MPARPPLLIEIVGLDGSDVADARQHEAALRACGAAPIVHLLHRDARSGSRDRASAEARAAVLKHRPDLVVVAGPANATADVLAEMPEVEVRWWPSEILDAPGPIAGGRRAALPLGIRNGATPAFDIATVFPPVARDGVGLWDGDYVLVPGPLGGDGAMMALDAFATVAQDAHGLDLVVLADPQRHFEDEAARLGISTRVHFAGRAPRTAEHTWFAGAIASWFMGDEPVHAGRILRALAAGCPLIPAGGGTRPQAVRAWLAGNQCLPRGASGEDMAEVLVRVLGRDATTRQVMERGRAVAAAHTPLAIAAQLGLPGQDMQSREVA